MAERLHPAVDDRRLAAAYATRCECEQQWRALSSHDTLARLSLLRSWHRAEEDVEAAGGHPLALPEA
jgi:hypothetical protein